MLIATVNGKYTSSKELQQTHAHIYKPIMTHNISDNNNNITVQ